MPQESFQSFLERIQSKDPTMEPHHEEHPQTCMENLVVQGSVPERIQQAVMIGKTPSEFEEKPYKNLYKSREVLESVMNELMQHEEKTSLDNEMLLGKVFHLLGVNYYDTDEFSNAERFFIKSINTLGDETKGTSSQNDDLSEDRIKNDTIIPKDINFIHYMNESYYYLGAIWTNRSEYHTALKYLMKSEEIYNYFKLNEANVDPSTKQDLENDYTLTAYYLAQVYTHLKDGDQASRYCFLTLQRQLNSGLEYSKSEWIENSIQLSSFFLEKLDYKTAIHFIKAAEYILMKTFTETEEEKELMAKISMAKGKLFLDKLEYSKEWVEQYEPSRIQHGQILTPLPSDSGEKILIEKTNTGFSTFYFDNIPIEHNETDSYVCRSFSEALEVFKDGKKAFEKALEYYVIDGFVSDHISLLQDLSSLYRCVIFFEENLDRKVAMHERRLDLLEKNTGELNVAYYRDLLKQLCFEVAETYVSIFELLSLKNKLKDLYKEVSFKKLNSIITKSLSFLTKFIGLFTDKGVLNVEPENKPAFFRAHLLLGRMYYNFISSDPLQTIDYMRKSLHAYEFCVKFYNSNVEILERVQAEMDLAKQMCTLLPMKISEINSLLRQ
ncbi:hypothetical protein C9374_001686 [Naegleria lovaniensis]|uniref:KIF-binding protein n=1 Tax=Naegleria lovaniensis TaxID=51637 RepID=A0AA88KMW5_NAELO|nr:uncharacterized protein C9374_001686 [Naegleria lovaniensis]KAG2387354.1 hypothetical protein C9374_001686 [Naegleria lovaniensis]